MFQVAGHCGGIARRDYGTGLALFLVRAAWAMAAVCGFYYFKGFILINFIFFI